MDENTGPGTDPHDSVYDGLLGDDDLEEAAKLENDLRAEIENAGGRDSSAADKFRADIEQLEAQLAAAILDRSRLQREVSDMKRDAETTWAAERVENALLRERINDVADEVARLTAVLEGPGSPIETILAQAVPDRGQAPGAWAGGNGRRRGPLLEGARRRQQESDMKRAAGVMVGMAMLACAGTIVIASVVRSTAQTANLA